MRKAVVATTGIVAFFLLWKEIFATIKGLLSVVGVGIVYTLLIGCVVSFFAMLFNISLETSEEDEPVYRG